MVEGTVEIIADCWVKMAGERQVNLWPRRATNEKGQVGIVAMNGEGIGSDKVYIALIR